MKVTSGPVAPPVRFAGVLLHQVTERGVSELRLARGGEEMTIQFDGQDQPAPKGGLFAPVVKAILRYAGVRLLPWTRKVSGRRLDIEFESSELTSAWVLETEDLKRELVLRRI